MKIKISTDSTCDLPAELIAAHDIGVLPLYIMRDGEALRDGIDVTPDDLYAYTKATGKLCGTSAVTIADYLTAWNGWLEDCDAIVHVAFSSELSVSCNNARLAAEELPGKVWVVDSLNLSTGFGHLVLDAALMAEKGMDPRTSPPRSNAWCRRWTSASCSIPWTICARAAAAPPCMALGANLLGLKPCIEVIGGKMTVGKKYRGKIEAAYVQYIKDRLANRSDIDTRRVFITDSGLPDELRQRLREVVLSCQPFEEVYNNRAGCTISGHCGPWCMGVLYYHK